MILILLVLFYIALFSSQSAIDLFDFLIVLLVTYQLIKKKKWPEVWKEFYPAWFWPLWIAILAVGLILNPHTDALEVSKQLWEFRWIYTFLIFVYLFRTYDLQSTFVRWIILAMIPLNVVAFVMFLFSPNDRAGGMMGHSMPYAHSMGPVFCLALIYLFSEWKRLKLNDRIVIGLSAATSLAMILFTMTRGVWVGVAVAVSFTFLVWYRKIFWKFAIAGAVLVAIALGVSHKLYDRVFAKTDIEARSNYERFSLWKANWMIVEDHPIFGIGYSQNSKELRPYFDKMGLPPDQLESHAHNQFLQFWSGSGTVGLICFIAFLFLLLQPIASAGSKAKGEVQSILIGLFCAILSFVIAGVTEANFSIAKNRFLFLLFAGIAYGISKSFKNSSKKQI
jgi:O-antigen ligase